MSSIQQSVIKIVVVDDHSLIADGLANCLAADTGLSLIGVVNNGLTAYEQCSKLKPDLVFMDLHLPGMNGIHVIRQLRRRWPNMMIIVLTAKEEENSAQEAVQAGAKGYILKKSSKNVLFAAIKDVLSGKTFIDPALDQQKMASLGKKGQGNIPLLTPREQQVLKLICEGKRNRDIAEMLVISLKTVETHRMNLMRKLSAHNTAELMLWVNRLGI